MYAREQDCGGRLVEGRGACFSENVSLMEFMYLVFTRMPDESYRSQTQIFVQRCVRVSSLERD